MQIVETPSPNFGARKEEPLDMLVLHYTGMKTAAEALQRLCDPNAEVSAHYLVEEDGTVHRLVDEANRAWHAGLAYWQGRCDINSHSIGIEIVNPGHEFGYRAFPAPQITSVIALCQDILTRHAIPAGHIVGHSDIAPDRKQDPGELFPWPFLAENGVGIFPKAPIHTDWDLSNLLTEIGYDPKASLRIEAFQRRFCPDHINGIEDEVGCGLAAAYLTAINKRS